MRRYYIIIVLSCGIHHMVQASSRSWDGRSRGSCSWVRVLGSPRILEETIAEDQAAQLAESKTQRLIAQLKRRILSAGVIGGSLLVGYSLLNRLHAQSLPTYALLNLLVSTYFPEEFRENWLLALLLFLSRPSPRKCRYSCFATQVLREPTN